MHKLAVVAAMILLVGCGPAVSHKSAGKSSAKNGKPKKIVAKATVAPSPPAPPPKKFTVAADAYPGIPEALAALLLAAESAGDGDEQTREERLKATGWLAMQKEAAVAPLAEKLSDESVGRAGKIVICRTLGQVGPAAEAPLTAALESEEQLVRINAAEQLAIIKPTNESIIKTLIGLLDHEDPRTRERAIKSLGFIGPPAKDAKDPLLAILNSNADEGVRAEAKKALKSVNPRHTFKD